MGAPSIDEAARAWRDMRQYVSPGVNRPDLSTAWHTVNNYFKEHGTCPEPVRHGADEMRCLKCHRVWERGEDKPPCPERD